ncbi:MAG: ABC transporter substrate-binding protein [Proteobacteria bacterium]|nr:ABC transporter substrate-binding protein [Pseudomonadota bacterium]
MSAPARTAEPAPANQVASLAGAPAGVVDQLYAGLLDTMRNGQQLGGEGRYRKLAPTVDRAFNLALMTEVAVGPRWSTLAPEQQRKLIEAFRRFTIASYANHFDGYDGERFAVAPEPQPVQAGVLVRTRLVTRDKPIALDYVLRETDGRWQIVDVYAEGTISEVARRRSEFNAVLSRSGADALADRLVEKAQTLIKEPA